MNAQVDLITQKYIYGANSLQIRRVEPNAAEQRGNFPDHWNSMRQDEIFKMVTLGQNSPEYRGVTAEFKALFYQTAAPEILVSSRTGHWSSLADLAHDLDHF